MGLTYLSPASRSSGQWGHGASVITRSSAQQLPHSAYKAMEGAWACHLAVPWAQRPRDLLTFTPYSSDVGYISAAQPLILLWTVLPRTQHSQLPFQGDLALCCPTAAPGLACTVYAKPWANLLLAALIFPWVSGSPTQRLLLIKPWHTPHKALSRAE